MGSRKKPASHRHNFVPDGGDGGFEMDMYAGPIYEQVCTRCGEVRRHQVNTEDSDVSAEYETTVMGQIGGRFIRDDPRDPNRGLFI